MVAGVSPTAVYRHFDDHGELLEAAVLHCWVAFDEALESSSDPEADPFDDFRRMGSAYAAFEFEQELDESISTILRVQATGEELMRF